MHRKEEGKTYPQHHCRVHHSPNWMLRRHLLHRPHHILPRRRIPSHNLHHRPRRLHIPYQLRRRGRIRPRPRQENKPPSPCFHHPRRQTPPQPAQTPNQQIRPLPTKSQPRPRRQHLHHLPLPFLIRNNRLRPSKPIPPPGQRPLHPPKMHFFHRSRRNRLARFQHPHSPRHHPAKHLRPFIKQPQ